MTTLRHDWTAAEINDLYALPFADLLFQAQSTHRQFFDPNAVQLSTLLSIKTGACPEDCAYCPQSAHYNTGLEKEKLLPMASILASAKAAKEQGASRFCMGAAWRSLPKKELPKMVEMIKAVKAEGLEVCVTLGMLDAEQAEALKAAGLDFYNHNLDSSPEFYKTIISTRTYEDRLNTLQCVREAGIKVCCGGIVGMGEARVDRVGLLQQLANLAEHPESVPINKLVSVPGTPLAKVDPIDDLEFIRTIAVARILMPRSFVRLSAGRESMSDAMQALCFFAGANSIFYGEKLLTTPNPENNRDLNLFSQLGIKPLYKDFQKNAEIG